MESWLIERDGVSLHGLWRRGNGSTIVVVPGAMADANDFISVVEAFESGGSVLILDRRGRGRSGEQGVDYGLSTEVADLCAWIDHLEGPVILVGWSLGGTIVLETAARDQRVASVIAYDPALPPFAAHAVPALVEADLDERVEIVNRQVTGLSADEVAALRETSAWPHLRDMAAAVAGELDALNRFEPSPGWDGVSAALIVGERCQDVEPYGTAFARVAARIPAASVTVLSGQGHLAHVENPQLLGRAINDLLTQAA